MNDITEVVNVTRGADVPSGEGYCGGTSNDDVIAAYKRKHGKPPTKIVRFASQPAGYEVVVALREEKGEGLNEPKTVG